MQKYLSTTFISLHLFSVCTCEDLMWDKEMGQTNALNKNGMVPYIFVKVSKKYWQAFTEVAPGEGIDCSVAYFRCLSKSL